MLRGMASPRGSALVLGAGIMGLSAAWALARAGHGPVTVIDQDPVPNPRGASCDHHRLIRHAYGAAHGYMRMVDDAYAAWDLLWAELGEPLYVETGVLALASARGTGWMAESQAALASHGLPPEALDAAAVARRFPMFDPAGIAEGFHLPRGGVLLAERIVAALARHCAARGVGFRRARVTEADPARARLQLEDGTTAEAELLVLAAGPWAPRLLPGLDGRVTASRQVVIYLEPPPAMREAWARAPMLLDRGTTGVGFYAVPPVAGTPLKIGDHRFSLGGDAERDPRETAPGEHEAILALAGRRLRGIEAYRLLGARACYYDVEPEERFILEPLEGGRCWVMSGFSGHGFKFGALLGLALARAATEPGLAAALPAWAAGQAPPPPGLLDAPG